MRPAEASPNPSRTLFHALRCAEPATDRQRVFGDWETSRLTCFVSPCVIGHYLGEAHTPADLYWSSVLALGGAHGT
jgi:hypothetical protein